MQEYAQGIEQTMPGHIKDFLLLNQSDDRNLQGQRNGLCISNTLEVDVKILRMAISKSIFVRKMQNG